MSKFDEALSRYESEMSSKLGIKNVDGNLLKAVTKSLGPSIYKADAAKVSCSDQKELDRLKNNFLIKKLGLSDGPKLDAAIKEVCETLGSSNPNKYRAIFYYLLVKKFKKEAMYL